MRRRGGEEEQATDIKSNNPHLAGGEKHNDSSLAALSLFVAMSAGLSAPITAPITDLTSKRFSMTKSCIHKILHDKCLKRPTPLRERTPLAADESRYKHIMK